MFLIIRIKINILFLIDKNRKQFYLRQLIYILKYSYDD